MNRMASKLFAAILISVALFVSFTPMSSAQSELLFGQTQYYSVVFRGNGEAVVYAKLIVNNPDDKPLADLSFEVPKVTPTEMAIYQMTLPSSCLRFQPMAPGMTTQPCAEYSSPNYDSGSAYYYGGYGNNQAQYSKIDFTNTGNLYKFTLPKPIDPYKSTAVIVAYAAKGYAIDSLGLFKFDFETLKVPSRINSVQVAVDVDSDLILKGKKATVNYETTPTSASGLGLSATSDFTSTKFNQTVSSIGYSGAMSKTAKNLSPNESFSVKGEYAASWWRLNLSGIIIALLVIAAIIVGIYFLARFLKRKSKKPEAAVHHSDQIFNNWINLTNVWVSFASASGVIIAVYVIIAIASGRFFQMPYDPTLSIISAIAPILICAIIVLAPGIIVAARRGWRSFVAILIGEFVWLIIFLALYMILFKTGVLPGQVSPSPMPVMY